MSYKEVYTCDNDPCNNEHPKPLPAYGFMEAWITLRRGRGGKDYYFCSWSCISNWVYGVTDGTVEL